MPTVKAMTITIDSLLPRPKFDCDVGKDASVVVIHQAQGHLCVCCADFHNWSWILVWILEDYGTDNWILKHVVDMEDCLDA